MSHLKFQITLLSIQYGGGSWKTPMSLYKEHSKHFYSLSDLTWRRTQNTIIGQANENCWDT